MAPSPRCLDGARHKSTGGWGEGGRDGSARGARWSRGRRRRATRALRSEEHTSELQSQSNLVCRLLLEKTNASQDEPVVATKGGDHNGRGHDHRASTAEDGGDGGGGHAVVGGGVVFFEWRSAEVTDLCE